MATQNSILHYLGIALAVFIGAIAARMIFVYMMANIAVAHMDAIGEQAQENFRGIQANQARQQEKQRKATQQQRNASKAGLDLYRRCAEYAEFYRDHPGDYAREQRDNACGDYHTYIRSGQQPR
jgi:uncharacterized membrane protein